MDIHVCMSGENPYWITINKETLAMKVYEYIEQFSS